MTCYSIAMRINWLLFRIVYEAVVKESVRIAVVLTFLHLLCFFIRRRWPFLLTQTNRQMHPLDRRKTHTNTFTQKRQFQVHTCHITLAGLFKWLAAISLWYQ